MNQLNLEELLASAARLFAERGYDGTGIRDIASISGTPSTSIYYHFKSKQDLYREALIALYEETFDHVSLALSKAGAGKGMDVLVDVVLDIFVRNKVLFALVQRDIVGTFLSASVPLIQEYHQRYMGLIERLLSQQAGRPVGKQAAVTVASLIFGYSELMLMTDGSDAAKHPDWLAAHKRHLREQVRYLSAQYVGEPASMMPVT